MEERDGREGRLRERIEREGERVRKEIEREKNKREQNKT